MSKDERPGDGQDELIAAFEALGGRLTWDEFMRLPLRVTGVVISPRRATGGGVDVSGRISTNGSAGVILYQWLFRPGLQPPQPLSQSVAAGQRVVHVTIPVEGTGHPQAITLQVLSPDLVAASTAVG